MPKKKLTKKYLDSVTAPSEGRADETIMDTEAAGLGIRIRASGSKTYCVIYKLHGRRRPYTLGPYHALSLEEARKRARAIRAEVANGGDPAADKRRRLRAPTVAKVIEFFFEHGADELRPSTVRNYRQQADRFILPALGNRKIEDVSRRDVNDLRRAMSATPLQANRVIAFLSRIFTFAMQEEVCETNPAARANKYREEPKERHLSDDEWRRLSAALEAETHREAANFVRLLMLTGARSGELLSAEWSMFDLDGERPKWIKPSSHTKQKKTHPVTLNRSAADLLRRMSAERDSASRFLFPSPHAPDRPREAMKRPWMRIRKRAGLDDVRIHDLRHTFASRAVSGGAPLYVVGQLLGHTQARTTERYAHLMDDAQRDAAERIGAQLEHIESSKPAELVPLPGRPERAANDG